MIKTLYAIPWYSCNLSCTHCDVKNKSAEVMTSKFMEVLQSTEAESIVLFGGEPLLYKDKFNQIMNTDRITCVSTNMLLADGQSLQIIKDKNANIATSWNPNRFKGNQLEQWLNNCKLAAEKDIPLKVLITLTPDLFELRLKGVVEIFHMMETDGLIKSFLFEPLIGQECNDKADKWLCKFHKAYDDNMRNELEENLKNWRFNCNSTYTLEPSGEIRLGCPQYREPHVLNKCITCDKASVCQPCMLQKTCSYPKRLAKLVEGENADT